MPVVHVITPRGVRFENRWFDKRCPLCRRGFYDPETHCPYAQCDNEKLVAFETPDKEILDALNQSKRLFGYNLSEVKLDKQTGMADIPQEDKNSGFVFDHPDTIVATVDSVGRELRRLKGPSKEPSHVSVAQEAVPKAG